MNKGLPKEIERFNIVFRLQHVFMLVTFLLLSFTGWALKFPELEQSSWWIKIWGGPEIAGKIHRVAGVGMLIDFAWHVAYIIYLFAQGRMKFTTTTTIVPLPQDIIDVVHNFLYFFGLSSTKPRFGRYSYIHKFDYWAVFWGMFIIGSSGFVLAFPVMCSYFFPSFTLNWIWPLLRVLHSDEALLAIVFILFWHFYNEHLKAEKFPMSWTWLSGKISIEDLKHEHPRDFEYLFPGAKKDE